MENDTTHKESCGCCTGETLLTSRKVRKAVTLTLIALAAFLVVTTVNGIKSYHYVGTDIAPVNVINVSGEGEAFGTPDTAEFTFSMMEEGATPKVVKDAVSAKAGAIIAALTEQGVTEENIKTVAYDLQPKYEWVQDKCLIAYPCPGKNIQKGFTLTQSVAVKVRDLDKAGDLLGMVSDKGATSVSGLSFTVFDDNELKATAREKAITNARTNAERLAKDLGVRLGRMVNFSESVGPVPMPYYAAKDMMLGATAESASAVVPAGQNRINSNVSITYEIVQ